MKRIIILLYLLFGYNSFINGCQAKKPRLTVIFVVDQFAYQYFPKLCPYFKEGLKFLITRGIVYENTYVPHGLTSTAPGHTTLATGITPHYHGIVGNSWCNDEGKKVTADQDDPNQNAILNPLGGFYSIGKGPAQIMIDSISDQFALASIPDNSHLAISLSYKSRSAICTATQLGKAIWLDENTGRFTSSQAYYHELPEWLIAFNEKKGLHLIKTVSWPLYYPANSSAYKFPFIDNYAYAASKPLAGKKFNRLDSLPDWSELFMHTPGANTLLLDLALECIKANIKSDSNQDLLLWICMSSLDIVGHKFGPFAKEVIDMLYHLDRQIGNFIQKVGTLLKQSDILYVLTADHGVSPIPEIMYDIGYKSARRLNYNTIMHEINNTIEQELGIPSLIVNCNNGQFFLDNKSFELLAKDVQEDAINLCKRNLLSYQGIKAVWTPTELYNQTYDENQVESWYKRQIFPGRTGKFIVQPFPYVLLDDNEKGTGHKSPYEYDSHIPLILYQKNNLEQKRYYQRVWSTQLANSLAHILQVNKPSASHAPLLPGIVENMNMQAMHPIVE